MASQQLYLFADSSTLANFKAWAQAISSWFTTCGWTQTADTGQVNWSTIASVPATGAFVYEIWQPGDTLQTGATAYYVKIQYGQSTSAGGIQYKLQIGTGTNGSGTLTGLINSIIDPTGGLPGQGTNIPYECNFAGDSGSIVITMWRTLAGTNSYPPVFGIERTLGPNGQPIVDGVCLCGINNSASAPASMQVLNFGKGVTTIPTNRWAPLTNFINANDIFNASTPATPLYPDYGKFGNPMTILCGIPASNISPGIKFKAKLYASVRTFMVIGGLNLSNPLNASVVWAQRFS